MKEGDPHGKSTNLRGPHGLYTYRYMSVYIYMYKLTFKLNKFVGASVYLVVHKGGRSPWQIDEIDAAKVISIYTCICQYIYICKYAKCVQLLCTWSCMKEADPHGKSTKLRPPQLFFSIYICICQYT